MSLASMTGFARSQGQHADAGGHWIWSWEIKSVNGRGLEVRLRLPSGFDALEMAARDAIGKRFKRGNINAQLTAVRAAETPALRVNEALLAQLAQVLRAWEDRLGAAPARLDGLLGIRGVLETATIEENDEDRALRDKAVLQSLAEAVQSLAAMRVSEGGRLAAILSEQLDKIESLSRAAASTAALRPEAIRERLRQQVAALLDAVPALSEERLSQEAVLLAAKGDVREELDRLIAHVAAARSMVAPAPDAGDSGGVGRKLDFLCQEFTREANTLCSKSSDVDLTRIGLDLKATIEQFREQVQNIE